MSDENILHCSPESYIKRSYRLHEMSGLVSTYVKMVETDLHILASRDVEEEAMVLVSCVRAEVERYIKKKPRFATSLIPLSLDTDAPAVIRRMLKAGFETGVGPMATVAGTIAEEVGFGLLRHGINDLIVENGGDIFISRNQKSIISIFAGTSPLSEKIGIQLMIDQMPCGVCCSSATVGHSLSKGQADAVVVISSSTSLADAAATSIGNLVQKNKAGSIKEALEIAKNIHGLIGVLIIMGQQLGAWGEIELVNL